MGVGHVAGHAGHYADALAKGRQVVLIVIETTGAMHADEVGMLYAWHAEARAEGCADRTVYGASRTACRLGLLTCRNRETNIALKTNCSDLK